MFSLQYHFLDLSKQLFDFLPYSFLLSESTRKEKWKRYSMFKRTILEKSQKFIHSGNKSKKKSLKKFSFFRFKLRAIFTEIYFIKSVKKCRIEKHALLYREL